MEDFLKTYGILILAIYGVVQIWLIAIWKNYIRTGKIEIFKTGRIEVGFSNFGPTLAFNGTLLAKEKDVFISGICISLKKTRDGSSHNFSWTAFRPNQLHIGKSEAITLEIPSGFIVKTDNPHRFHIFFSDNIIQNEITQILLAVQKEWRNFLNLKNDEILKAISEIGVTYDLVAEHIYENEFVKTSQAWHKAWDILNRKNYWEEGEYSARLLVNASMPNKSFEVGFNFRLSENAFENLRLNAIATLRELTLGKSNYLFEYVDFE